MPYTPAHINQTLARFEAGEQLNDEAMECCRAIRTSNEEIQAYNQEIANIKEEPSQTAAATTVPAQPNSAAEENITCEACGSQVLFGKKFCPECGTPIVQPEPAVKEVPVVLGEEPLHCAACGEVVAPGKKFCAECGAPMQFN